MLKNNKNICDLMKKFIIFDFDGTIADTFSVVEEIANEYVKKYSIKLDPKEARVLGLKKVLIKSKFPIWKIPAILPSVKKRIGLRLKNDVNLFKGMKNVLKQLSKKYHLGIVSTNSKESIMIFLTKYKISSLFKFVHSDSSLFGKHIVLKRSFKKYHLTYNDVVYVGDEDRDIQAAKKSHIKIIAVSWGYNSKSLLLKNSPDYIADNPKQLLKILS